MRYQARRKRGDREGSSHERGGRGSFRRSYPHEGGLRLREHAAAVARTDDPAGERDARAAPRAHCSQPGCVGSDPSLERGAGDPGVPADLEPGAVRVAPGQCPPLVGGVRGAARGDRTPDEADEGACLNPSGAVHRPVVRAAGRGRSRGRGTRVSRATATRVRARCVAQDRPAHERSAGGGRCRTLQ